MRKDFARAQLAGSVAVVCLSLAPVVANAQAWLPDKGSASFSLAYSNVLHKFHYSTTDPNSTSATPRAKS